MYFGSRHTATAMGLNHVERTCRKCGRRAVAEVAAEGAGIAHAPFLFDPDGADLRAGDYAAAALTADARISVGLLRCPACGARDSSAILRAILRGAKPAIVLAPLAFMLTFFIVGAMLQRRRDVLLTVAPPTALAVALAVSTLVAHRRYRQLIARAEAAASWLPDKP
jgi:hypothetical protein